MKYRYKIYDANGNSTRIVYRYPWKVAVNNVLRILQFWTKNKYVVATITDCFMQGNEIIKEVVVSHKLLRVEHSCRMPSTFKKQLKTTMSTAVQF